MLKKMWVASAIALVSISSFAAEIRDMKIENFRDISIVFSPETCTKMEDVFLGIIEFEKTVDCYSIFLRDVSGTDQLGNPVSLNNVLLVPVAETLKEANEMANYLIAAINQKVCEDTTVEMSNLRYTSKEHALSLITQDQNDTTMVKRGSVTLSIISVRMDGGWRATETKIRSLGQ